MSRENAQSEYEKLIQWVLDEEDKIVEKLKAENRYILGLDTNSKEFQELYRIRNQKIKELKEKYK